MKKWEEFLSFSEDIFSNGRREEQLYLTKMMVKRVYELTGHSLSHLTTFTHLSSLSLPSDPKQRRHCLHLEESTCRHIHQTAVLEGWRRTKMVFIHIAYWMLIFSKHPYLQLSLIDIENMNLAFPVMLYLS